jgi:putative transposase
MVEGGEYLWRCLCYIELNMVRCGVVPHPSQWTWSGYAELMGTKQRNRLLDVSKLLSLLRTDDLQAFRRNFQVALEETLAKRSMLREPKWTEAVAVGSAEFVSDMEAQVRNRQVTRVEEDSGVWALREGYEPQYGVVFGTENRAIDRF